MSKYLFVIIVTVALFAMHSKSQRHAQQKQGTDTRLVWTIPRGGKLEASLQIKGQNHARILIWRSASDNDGGFEPERKIFEKSFTDANAHPRAHPAIILDQPPETNPTRYRFEVFTSRTTATTDWQPLSGPALMDHPAMEYRGVTLNFEDSLKSGSSSDFKDIILTLREVTGTSCTSQPSDP